FRLRGVDEAGFDDWVGRVRSAGRPLQTASYLALEKPSEKAPVMHFASVAPDLFSRVVNRCVRPGAACIHEVMARERKADGGHAHGGAGEPLMPRGRGSMPPHGDKPEGALMKAPEEIAPGSTVTKPRAPGTPGATQPDSPKNRDMAVID